MKFYLYARKSTDDEDHQIMSIEAQLFELRQYAQREGLKIIEEITENKTAKKPGREKFTAMIDNVEKSNGVGILAWHPDRLARNSVDGGRVIYLVDTGKIAALRFPTFWFEPTPQGKFMLSIAFGQSKYYIDNLSENVKRGLREKLRRGILPGLAPLGYVNDLRSHTIEPDKQTFKKVKAALEAFSTGKYTLSTLKDKIAVSGLAAHRGRPLRLSSIQRMLANPFYCGMFKYQGELHQGNHKPMISKKIHDQIQQALINNGKPRKAKVKRKFLFRNFAVCGECGYSITAEHKTKKSGKQYVYYRCSYKSIRQDCGQHRYLREDDLAQQIKESVQRVALSVSERDLCLSIVSEWENENRQPSNVFEQSLKTALADVKAKIDRLGDAYLDNAYELDEYKEKKNLLVEKKKEIEEKLADFKAKGNRWLELTRKLIFEANQAQKWIFEENFAELRNFLEKYGWNPKIQDCRFAVKFKKPLIFLEKGANENRGDAADSEIFGGYSIWRARRDLNP